MKNFLIAIIITLAIFGVCCFIIKIIKDTSYYYYKVNVKYEIVYPDTVIRYDTVFNCATPHKFINKSVTVKTYAERGANIIWVSPGYNPKISTTCPIRVLSFQKIN
jgi:hypothetical protein